MLTAVRFHFYRFVQLTALQISFALSCRKGRVSFSSWSFHGAGLPRRPGGDTWQQRALHGLLRGSPVETQYSGLQEALQSTVNSQGSCFPVSVSVAVYVRAAGKAPPASPLRNENSSIPQRGELLSASLLLLSFLSKVQSAASVPCFRFLRLATTELPSSPASWFPAPARAPLLLLL